MRLIRRLGVSLFGGLFSAMVMAAPVCDGWPQWQSFRAHFISEGGRVIDRSMDNLATTSEGQSYGMFFALVANDRPTFDSLLNWTSNNLAAGDLSASLPAWQWGRRDDGSWGVIDPNSASDSDLWIAYTLLEAGRIWREPKYTALGQLLAQRVLREETAEIPGLGLTLLPGKVGFTPQPDVWRLNPSYVPPQLMARLASGGDAKWRQLRKTSLRLLLESAPVGFSPDWVLYRQGKGFVADESTKAVGSYNAIRVYLWVGMMAGNADSRAALLRTYKPMALAVAANGVPPEEVDTLSGKLGKSGSVGFSAALLPFLAASGQKSALEAQLQRQLALPLSERPDAYYDHVLTLFGLGWQQGRYAFLRNGEVKLAWEGKCPA